MAYASFATWADFTAGTSISLPRYYTATGGLLVAALGISANGVSHLYTAQAAEEIDVAVDEWFVGATYVIGFGL